MILERYFKCVCVTVLNCWCLFEIISSLEAHIQRRTFICMFKRRVDQWTSSISIKVTSQHCGNVQYIHYKIVFLPLENQTKLHYITVLAMSHIRQTCSFYIVKEHASKSSRIRNWRERKKNTFPPWTSKNACVLQH